jgi:hypothetical protein
MILLANGVWAWEDCFKIDSIEKEIIIEYKKSENHRFYSFYLGGLKLIKK